MLLEEAVGSMFYLSAKKQQGIEPGTSHIRNAPFTQKS